MDLAPKSLPSSTPWTTHVIDGDGTTDFGQYVSLVVDPASNVPFVSYYDATHGNLRLAHHVQTGGNCGSGGSWSCETVDNGGDGGNVGRYTSLDLYPGSGIITRKLGISYYDAGNYALKYAQYTWSPAGFKWSIETIQIGSFVSAHGLWTSLKFDSDGVPHIAYHYVDDSGYGALMYAYKEADGSSSNGSISWTCALVDSGDSVGQYASLGPMDMAAGKRLEIAYYDRGKDELKRALYTGSFGSGCYPANHQWACHWIDLAGGSFTSAGEDADDDMHIAYHDQNNGRLRYATRVGSGGVCGPGDTWDCRTVADMGISVSPIGISLLLDRNDLPLIAYRDNLISPESSALRVARKNPVLGMFAATDTRQGQGPERIAPTWLFETIDSGDAQTKVGRFISAGQDQSGNVIIAYYERDTASGSGRLKVAWQQNTVFLPLVQKDSQ